MELRFGRYGLDVRGRRLLRGSEALHLSPKAFDLLVLLASEAPGAVPKTAIHRHLWPNTFVSDVNLAVLVAEIRAALGDAARESAYVRTVHRFGYAFVAPVTRTPADEHTDHPALCSVAWGTRHVLLAEGAHLIGRDPRSAIHVDAIGVSRVHASIQVTSGDASLHDLSSKNGTFVDGVRVLAHVNLGDGADIRVGPVALTFRRLTVPATESWIDTSARSGR